MGVSQFSFNITFKVNVNQPAAAGWGKLLVVPGISPRAINISALSGLSRVLISTIYMRQLKCAHWNRASKR